MAKFDHSQEIRAAQVRLLYDQLPSALIATIINAAILSAVLWRQISPPLLIGWLLVILLLVFVRYFERRGYLQDRLSDAKSLEWANRCVYGAAANGLLWGFAGFFFFAERSYVHQVFLAFVLLGMVSGGISTLSSSRSAYLVFLVLALLPYGVRLVTVADGLHLAMGGMLIVYVAMMGMIGNRLYATGTESLRLRFDNLNLLQDVRQAQGASQKAYAELELRVEERTAELQESEEALRNADRRKDEFLAMLGHELRNPLAPILNALRVMNIPDASDSTQKWARDVIDRQINRLTRLVDDLLDVSRIMYGKISLQETVLEIASVIHHAVEGSLPLIEARDQKLAVRVPQEPLWVKGDLVRLDQVVTNLINNASKYSDVGAGIGMDVKASEDWVTVSVQDNGIGIPGEVLPRVFDLFAQANHSLARTQGGLGVGLTVVKRLVEMHGGRVEAHSQGPGRGSEFLVHLPRQQNSAREQEGASPNQAAVGSKENLRMLVVDDNQDSADTLAVLMGFEGYTVAVGYDGLTAMSEAARFQPHVVLLDIGMPGMDGYQVARELRASESIRSMILIALTGYGQPEDRECAKAAGFDDHLTKPVDPELLKAVLNAHNHVQR